MKNYFKHLFRRFNSTPSEIRILKLINLFLAIGLCYCSLSFCNYQKLLYEGNLLEFNELPDLYAKKMVPWDVLSGANKENRIIECPDEDGDIHGELLKSYFDSIKSLYQIIRDLEIARDIQNRREGTPNKHNLSPFTESENKRIGEILSKLAESKLEKVLISSYSAGFVAYYRDVRRFLRHSMVHLEQGGKLPIDRKTYLTGLLAFISHVDNGNRPLQDLMFGVECRQIFLDICEIVSKEGFVKEDSESLIKSFAKSKTIRSSLSQTIQAEAQGFHSCFEKVKTKYPIGYFISSKLYGDPIIQAKEFYDNPLLYNNTLWKAHINPFLRMHLPNIPKAKVEITEFLLRENKFIASLQEINE